MLRFSFALYLLLTLLACGTETAQNNAAQSPPTADPQATPPSTGEALYPSISVEEMQTLWNTTTSIDYLFYELPISMNMTEKTAIQSTLKQISDRPALVKKECKAMGRVFFQNNGNPIAEADFYFAPGCTYFIFMENQKPVKSNQMTPEGIQFFQNLLVTAKQGQ